MNKIYRKGVDVGVAFASDAKRLQDKVPQPIGLEPNLANVEKPPVVENANAPEQSAVGLRGIAKGFLRLVAKFVYRLFKPALRSIAFRSRWYLTEGLRQDTLGLRQDILGLREDVLGLREDILGLREDILGLREDILGLRQYILQEQQRLSASMLQELQAAIDSLRQDVLNAHSLSQQELLRVSAGVLEEVQAARESLRQEVQVLASNLCPRLDRIELYSAASARRVAINCGQGEILVKAEVGYVLCSATDYAVLACLIDAGELERGTRLLIQRLLKPGDVFVDVGANLGLHTLAAARAMQGRGNIIAFEPFEPTKRLLEKSVWINGFSEITEIHQAAVSNFTGHQKLFLGATSGHHSLFPLDVPSGLASQPVEVPLVRLDDVIQAGQKVTLIKIDVEGAELEVLESAASVIKHTPDIAFIVEFGPTHLKRTGHSTQQWLSAFTDIGLIYRAINADTGMLEDWPLEQMENTGSVNLFFARTDSTAWIKVETTAI